MLDYRKAVRIILLYNEQILLVQQNSNVWVPPGGGIDPGETPKQAIIRELYEELGIQETHYTIHYQSKHTHTYDIPKQQQKQHCGQHNILFVGKLHSPESISIDKKEIKDVRFANPQDISFPEFIKIANKILQEHTR